MRGSEALIEEAIAAYRAALEERTQERVPLDWAMTQNNLGNALSDLGRMRGSEALIEEAIAAYRAALEELTQERVPLDWAMTQNNLGAALSDLGLLRGSEALIEEAIGHIEAALSQFRRLGATAYIEFTEKNLAQAKELLAQVKDCDNAVEEFSMAGQTPLLKPLVNENLLNRLQSHAYRPMQPDHLRRLPAPFHTRTSYNAKTLWPEEHRRHLNEKYGLVL